MLKITLLKKSAFKKAGVRLRVKFFQRIFITYLLYVENIANILIYFLLYIFFNRITAPRFFKMLNLTKTQHFKRMHYF